MCVACVCLLRKAGETQLHPHGYCPTNSHSLECQQSANRSSYAHHLLVLL